MPATPSVASTTPSIAAAAPAAPSPLRIAVLGVGKIGSTFAFQLAHAGHDVTAVVRPGSVRLAQLRRDGGIVLKTGESAAVPVADQLDEQVAYDLILVTMYDHQVEAVLPALRRSRAAAVQFMFVTFHPGRLRAAVGSDRASFGMPAVMARLDEEGRLSPMISSRQKTLHGDRRWMQLFIDAGIPSAFDPDMARWLRCHVPLTVAMESVCVAGVQRGRAASWQEAAVIARGTRAGYAIIRGLGGKVYPRSKRVIASLPVLVLAALLRLLSGIKSFRELLANGAAEARAHVDAMAAAGEEATPALAAAVAAVRAMRPPEGTAAFRAQ